MRSQLNFKRYSRIPASFHVNSTFGIDRNVNITQTSSYELSSSYFCFNTLKNCNNFTSMQ